MSRADGTESFDRQRQITITLDLDYLEDIVETRLARAVEQVVRAARHADLLLRETEMNFARADYSVAHVLASLVDARCYDANEWPVFTTWARDLMHAAGGVD